MKIYANAKVNLALDVKERNKKGYHTLDMIMAPASIADEIEIVPAPKGETEVLFDGKKPEFADSITKALEVLDKTYGLKSGYKVNVAKHIPDQAGLAGGSADAAAVLKAVNVLEGLELDENELMEAGVKVGADVPFCIYNDWARVKGIGQEIIPLDTDWQFDILLVKPKSGISTKECFDLWDAYAPAHYDVDIVQTAAESQNTDLLYQTMENALEEPAMELLPELASLKEAMLEEGLVRVLMTGSGSALMGFSVDESTLQHALEALKDKADFAEIITIGKTK